MNILKTNYMSKLYLTISKKWLLKNHPKMTLQEICNNKIIQDKPFIEQTGFPIVENWTEYWDKVNLPLLEKIKKLKNQNNDKIKKQK